MVDAVILVDFGASRVKALLWSFKRECVIARTECPAPKLIRGPHGEAEGDPEDYWQALVSTAGRLVDLDASVRDIWLCAEMHGFLLATADTYQPITRYISWQDQRAVFAGSQTHKSKLDELKDIFAGMFQGETGLRLRAGLPIVTLASIHNEVNLHRNLRFLTLTDWLLLRGGEHAPHCHPTMAAGTGFYSLVSGGWSEQLSSLAGIPFGSIVMPALRGGETLPIGSIRLGSRVLRVWGGLGDMQAAAIGAGFPKNSSVFINLGTGSQVLAASQPMSLNTERRLCVGNVIANGITHIPAGRALNTFASFIDECSFIGGGQPLFWAHFGNLRADEVLASSPSIDLNIFSSAWQFTSGGSIKAILEQKLTLTWFLKSLAISWLTQYKQALDTITSDPLDSTFLVGGGLSRRAAFAPIVLENLLSKNLVQSTLRTGEESLEGLLNLAETCT